MPDVMLARAAGLELGETRRRAVLVARSRPRCPASTPPATSASTTAPSTAARCAIEHWDVAFNHGKTAALNMLGRDGRARGRPVLLLRPRRLGVDRVRGPGLGRRGRSAARWTTASSRVLPRTTGRSRPRSRWAARRPGARSARSSSPRASPIRPRWRPRARTWPSCPGAPTGNRDSTRLRVQSLPSCRLPIPPCGSANVQDASLWNWLPGFDSLPRSPRRSPA